MPTDTVNPFTRAAAKRINQSFDPDTVLHEIVGKLLGVGCSDDEIDRFTDELYPLLSPVKLAAILAKDT